MKRKIKKNYKRLSRFDKSIILGLIIDSIKKNIESGTKRVIIHEHVKNCKEYNDLIKLIKNGIIRINKEKKYFLTSHGEEIWVKYNREWISMPPLNKQR